MKIKEVAEQIYQAEQIINISTDKDEIEKAKNKIEKLANQVTNLEDLFLIDEYIQKKLKK